MKGIAGVKSAGPDALRPLTGDAGDGAVSVVADQAFGLFDRCLGVGFDFLRRGGAEPVASSSRSLRGKKEV